MASDFFIKIDGIDGESVDKSHSKWIEVTSFEFGTHQNITAGRGADVSGRGEFRPFVFTHLIDKASPKLMHTCMSGKNIPKVDFHVCRAIGGAQAVVYEVTMTNIKVVNVAAKVSEVVSGAVEGNPPVQPVEEVQLVAGKMTWKVTPIKPDGSKDGAVEASFDQTTNS